MLPKLLLSACFLFCSQLAFSSRWQGRQGPGNRWSASGRFPGTGFNPYVKNVPMTKNAVSPKGNSTNPIVVTQDGAVRGFTMRTISSRPITAFRGIPFAQPPVGDLRFRDPIKNEPWTGVRDATAESPQCSQLDVMKQYEVHGQEDCLYLNVYTPPRASELNKSLPVMVYIHGGAWMYGAGSIYGPLYLLDQDIVLVILNYRVGPLGFLSTGDDASPGNQGMKDMVLALQWVQDNIKAFGGDPNSVTIFGQSAGGAAVQHLIVSPMSRGLFHRAISQSGSSMCPWSIAENASEIAERMGALFNCRGNSEDIVNCLRTVDANQLVSAPLNLTEWNGFPFVFFAPVVEHDHPNALLVETPEETYRQNRAAKVPWITGYNKNEMAWLISALFLNSTAVVDLNNNWDRVAPIFLGIKNGTGNDAEIVRRIREFYFGDRELTFNTRHSLVNLFTDGFFLECGLEAMRYHSLYTEEPVYAYQFSYRGKYSVVQSFRQNPRDWGVAHGDDLIYLFNNTDYHPTLRPGPDDEELKMSQIFAGIWSSFATYGRPFVKNAKGLQDIWQPIPKSSSLFSPLKFLDLNLIPRMIDDPFVGRYHFWRNLQLVD